MALQIIFFVSMYPILFVLYFVMRGMGDAKDGYSFGAGMKTEWLAEAEVQRIIEDYKKELKKITLHLAWTPVLTFFIPYMSISYSLWMIWVLAVLVVPGIPYVKANGRMKAFKRDHGLYEHKNRQNLTELKQAGTLRRVKFLPFFVPIAVGILAAAWSLWELSKEDWLAMGILTVTFALVTPLFYGAAVWMDSQKNEVISNNSEVNLNYARAKKNLWKDMWLLLAWGNTVFTIILSVLVCSQVQTEVILWGTLGYTVLTLGVLLAAWKKAAKIDGQYAARREIVVDDDEYWIWGMFYYNKNDSHTMVNKRNGIGTTTNMATPAGLALDVVGLLSLLVIPISCIWLVLEEFTPIHLAVENEVLYAEHLKAEYEIPVSEITNLTVVIELPKWSKSSGTGMDNLCKGTFHVRNDRDYQVFLNPQNEAFLRIETEDEIYYMSGFDDDETKETYENLVEYIDGE